MRGTAAEPYGFAGSDQVNNSDPFGLCDHKKLCRFLSNVLSGMEAVATPGGKCDGPGCATGAFIGLALMVAPTAKIGVGAAGPRSAVSVSESVAAGLVKDGGTLQGVLQAIEVGAKKAGPTTANEALDVVAAATKSVGLEPGILSTLEGGGYQLKNVGNVTTTISASGVITVEQGANVVLRTAQWY